MKTRRRKIGFFSGLFGILGAGFAILGICLALLNMNASPVLVQQPEAARTQVSTMLDAFCAGDYDAVSACLYGNPSLGMDREPEDEVGRMFWEALEESFAYEILGDFHATDSGVALDVKISAMDLNSVTANLRQRAQTMLEERIAAAEDPSEIYDENNEYREDFVMDTLRDAARAALREDAQEISWELTLNLIYENGQWWIMPEQGLLKALSGGILN